LERVEVREVCRPVSCAERNEPLAGPLLRVPREVDVFDVDVRDDEPSRVPLLVPDERDDRPSSCAARAEPLAAPDEREEDVDDERDDLRSSSSSFDLS
ncbi:MAG: hypothetical protein AAF311_14330, partial [Pseudomonadota bacterium]